MKKQITTAQFHATESFWYDVEGFLTATMEEATDTVEHAFKLLPKSVKIKKNVVLSKKGRAKFALASRKILEAHKQLLAAEQLLSDVSDETNDTVQTSDL